MLATVFGVKNRLLPRRILGKVSLHEMSAPQQAGTCCRLPGSHGSKAKSNRRRERLAPAHCSALAFLWGFFTCQQIWSAGGQARGAGGQKNHRMACVGQDVKDHLVTTSCHGQRHLLLITVSQDLIQPGLEYFHGFNILSWI